MHIFYNLVFVWIAIFAAVIGGVAFGQWPRPSRVRRFRAIGIFFGLLSIFSASCYMLSIYEDTSNPASGWVYVFLALGPSLLIWIVTAFLIDYDNGGHIFFAKQKDEFIIELEPAPPKQRIGGNIDIKT